MDRCFAEQNRVISGFRTELNNDIAVLRTDLCERMDHKFEALDNKMDGLKFWIEDRYDPVMQSLRDYLPSTGKTYSDLEMRVAENTVSIKDCCITSVDHENRIKQLEKTNQKQERIV